LRDYVAMVRAHWFALAVFTLLGVVVASVAGYAATPEYTAKAELVVVADTGSTADLTQGSDYTQKQIRTFSELATRPIVLQPAIENLGLAATANEVARQLSVTNVLGTNLISIRTTDPDPQVAADLANEVADQLTVAVSGIVPVLENGEKSVRLKSIRTALPPESPSSPNLPVWAVLGAIGGLVAGALAVALREVLDTKVRDAQTAKAAARAPLLGSITLASGPNTFLGDEDQKQSEEYRQIRTNVSFLAAGDERRLFAITSSVPGEGKSKTAANLALTLASAGHRVCLLEADLRRPSLGPALGLESAVGLTTVLIGRASVADVVQEFGEDGLHVLLAGQQPPNPSELLASQRMDSVIDELGAAYEIVIIDCPPLLPVTDAVLIAHRCGGALLVVGVGVAQRGDVSGAVATLATAGIPILGVIANRVKPSRHDKYDYTSEVVPGLVDFEVAVPRLTAAVG